MEDEDTNRRTEEKHSTVSSENASKSSCNPSTVIYKAYYFLFFTAIGSNLPYLALYFKQIGLSAGQAGALVGVRLFTEFIGSPVWGMVGDRYKIRKIILFASLLSFSAGTLLLIAVQPQNQKCIETTGNETVIKSLTFTPEGIVLGPDNEVNVEADINKNTSDLFLSPTTTFTRKVDQSELTKIFVIFLSIIFAAQIIGSVVYTMPDALVVGFLEEDVNKFGHFRMWGEVGVAVGSFLVGGVISAFKSEVCGEIVKNYHISFYFFAGFIALAMFTVIFMEVKYPDQKSSLQISFKPVFNELLRCNNLIFIAVACYLGILNGLQENFGLWYLDDLGAQPYMIGMAAGFRYCVALFGYVSSGALINKIGLVPTLAGCLMLYIAVFLGLSFVLNPWLSVVLFSVQGLLHGLGWSACVLFGANVSLQVGFYATVQGKSNFCLVGISVQIVRFARNVNNKLSFSASLESSLFSSFRNINRIHRTSSIQPILIKPKNLLKSTQFLLFQIN